MSLMADCFNRNKCDKGDDGHPIGHKYYKIYEPRMEPFKDEPIKILEIGIWKGNSIAAFHDYFTEAELYGVDVFTRLDPKTVDVLQWDRVKWIKHDSTKPTVADKIKEKWGDVKFDFIIDDGLHTPAANLKTFKNLFSFLKEGGSYFIEDVYALHDFTLKESQHPWIVKHADRYNPVVHQMLLEWIESKGEVKYHDLRIRNTHSFGLDSYIIEIVK